MSTKSIGARKFKHWLKRHGYTYKRAAVLFRVTPAAISFWANGQNRPAYPQMQRLQFNAGITISDWHTPIKYKVGK